MTADTFVCDCGQTLITKIKPGAYYQHRRADHAYCGQCHCEPCQCDRYGLSKKGCVMTTTETTMQAAVKREESTDDLSDIDEGPF